MEDISVHLDSFVNPEWPFQILNLLQVIWNLPTLPTLPTLPSLLTFPTYLTYLTYLPYLPNLFKTRGLPVVNCSSGMLCVFCIAPERLHSDVEKKDKKLFRGRSVASVRHPRLTGSKTHLTCYF